MSAFAANRKALPDPHCRIVRVRFKRRTRYRSPDAFNLVMNLLLGTKPDERGATREVRQ